MLIETGIQCLKTITERSGITQWSALPQFWLQAWLSSRWRDTPGRPVVIKMKCWKFWWWNVLPVPLGRWRTPGRRDLQHLGVRPHCDVPGERGPSSWQRTGGNSCPELPGTATVVWKYWEIRPGGKSSLANEGLTCDKCSRICLYVEDNRCLLQYRKRTDCSEDNDNVDEICLAT